MPNDNAIVPYYTLSTDETPNDAQREAVETIVRRERGAVHWRASKSTGRSYALVELSGASQVAALSAALGATVHDMPIIAIALFPTVPEALLGLGEALGGAGAPVGVLACRPCDGGLVVEWDPQRSSAAVVMGLIDVELARYHSGRTVELLSPLPPEYVSAIAADGLATPEIGPDRVIEMLLDRANLRA